MNQIKAIETVYNGYRFHSRLEARYAVFFDALGIKYEYEKEGYDLGEAGWYLPDFWLPELKCWIEIKGESPSADEKKKLESLFAQTETPCFIFWCHPPASIEDMLRFEEKSGAFFLECSESGGGHISTFDGGGAVSIDFCEKCKRAMIFAGDETTVDSDWQPWPNSNGCLHRYAMKPILQAGIKARQARFEHGETPKP